MNKQTFKTSRLEAISDGVFAIAMTLLVLDLKLSDLPAPVSAQVFRTALMGQLPHLISWLISFAILCRLWMTQHWLLKSESEHSRSFTWLNFAFLGVVSFIPFPTSLISEHAEQPLSVVIFSSVFAIAGLLLGVMCSVKQSTGSRSETWSNLDPTAKRIIIGMPCLAIISSAIAFINTQTGILLWVLMPFVGFSIKMRHRINN